MAMQPAECIRFQRNRRVGAAVFVAFAVVGLAMAVSPSGGEANNSPGFGVALLLVACILAVVTLRSSRVEVDAWNVVVHQPLRRKVIVPLRDIASASSAKQVVGVLPRRVLVILLKDGRSRPFPHLNQRPGDLFERIGPVGRTVALVNRAVDGQA